MCCSTGVCGPNVDPELVRFAANLDWLTRQGIEVERHTLSQNPAAFVGNAIVKGTLDKEGNAALLLTLPGRAAASAPGELLLRRKRPGARRQVLRVNGRTGASGFMTTAALEQR